MSVDKVADTTVAKRNVWAKASPHPKAELHYFDELHRTALMGRFAGLAACGYSSNEIQTGYKDGETPPVSHRCRACWKKRVAPVSVCGVQEGRA